MGFLIGTLLLAIVTALCCALPGVFIVLRREAMVVDAIAHAILPGVIVGYALTLDLRSPVLTVTAAAGAMLVVLGSDWLRATGLVAGDAPQGLVFPALFAVGILLVSTRFEHIHLDVHAVLVGDLNLAAFDPLVIGGIGLGPSYLWVMLGLLAIIVTALLGFGRGLALITLDRQFARASGVPVRLLSAGFMLLVAITVTASFHSAGAILVLALMIAPPATAVLLADRLGAVFALTAVIAVGGAALGFGLAYVLDAPTSAGMAVCSGLVLAAAWAWTRLRARITSPVRAAAR